MKRLFVLALLSAGLSLAGAESTQPLLYTVNSVQYVNPFNFAQAYGGKISGKSGDKQWIITLRGRSLKLLNNSATAYLDGRRVTLSKVVGYAKGTLLAPHTDLARLLGVSGHLAQTVNVQPVKSQVTVRPLRPAVSSPAPATPEVQPVPAPAVTATAAPVVSAPAPATTGPARSAGAYVIQSDVPSRTDALERSNFQEDVDPQSLSVETVVRACQSGVAKQLGSGAPTFAARPFVFVHPENVYSVRSSADLEVQGQSSRASFTCLSQVQGARLVMFIELSGSR
ncbi:hypothetical protein [Deinococcus peraridilitoris]|uniref:Copper amine oxidase family protein n=1 Tax=Deinococcus peraridilitoris (strain DSM 19664 / LMG 22246 / CIP 109416 / KR-200) TaxID=937777 RepID=L0A3L6_DEIPD|nr:hypothetical protein [Deinococcus peraridilitoris]AFZ68441.1 hypothetical protein Deipe_2990 [Deinococcus peraridilitoris DSM 19664]